MAKKEIKGKKPEKELNSRDRINLQIKDLEKELSTTKYNKKTQHHIGLVKAKIAKLKENLEQRAKGGKKGEGYSVRKSGDGTVVLLGFPSVGKSTLLNNLTNADSEIGHYAFTTLTAIPGMMNYKHAQIQIVDVPGIVHGASAGTGRGKEVLQVVRNADFILILLDVFHPEYKNVLLKEVYDTGVRINQEKPDVRIKKTIRGGLQVGSSVPLSMIDEKTVKGILKEFKIVNGTVLIRTDIDADQLIDIVEGNKVYIPAITALNKIDLIDEKELKKIKQKIKPDLCISADKSINIDDLKELIFEKMNFMRLYCKEVGKKADLEVPLIIKKDSTIKNMCEKLHKDFVSKFKFARVWGKSAKFPGQKLMLKHVLKDEDVVELHIR